MPTRVIDLCQTCIWPYACLIKDGKIIRIKCRYFMDLEQAAEAWYDGVPYG